MTDVQIKTDSELMVAHVEGVTPNGEGFVNNYVARQMIVLDADRIIVHTDELPTLLAKASELEITTEQEIIR